MPDPTAGGAARNPIDLLSLSDWQIGEACLLRLAFRRDPAQSRWDRTTPARALGSVRHRLEEEVAKGRADASPLPAEIWVRRRWDDLIDQVRQEMTTQWAPAFVARPDSWDGFYATLAALVQSLGPRIEQRRAAGGSASTADREPSGTTAPATVLAPLALAPAPRPTNPSSPPPPGFPFSEVTLVDAARHLVGRLDHLEARDGGLTVVDFKSFSRTGRGPNPAVRTQLLFYAGLVEAAWGVWPELAVSRPAHAEEPVVYATEDAIGVRASAAAFRQEWNSANETPTVAAGAERCQWCEFQAVCPAFRDGFSTDMNADPRRVRAHSLASGAVTSVRRIAARETRVEIAQERDLTCPPGRVTIARLPADLDVVEGDLITVARLDRGGGTSTVRAAWNSLIEVTRDQ